MLTLLKLFTEALPLGYTFPRWGHEQQQLKFVYLQLEFCPPCVWGGHIWCNAVGFAYWWAKFKAI